MTIGESQAFGGVLKGSLALAASDAGADFKSQLQFTDVDLENCLGDMFQFRRLEGRGDIALALDATGNSVLALTRTLNGTANLTGRQGALVGLNVEQLLRRLERRPLSGTGDFRNGRTPFEKLTVDLKIAEAPPRSRTCSLEGSKVRLGLAGIGLDPGARVRPARGRGAGHRPAPATPRRRSNCRSWCRARGTIRSCCRTPRPDPALAGGKPAARRGEEPQHPRHRPLGDRAADRRRRQPAGRRPPPSHSRRG